MGVVVVEEDLGAVVDDAGTVADLVHLVGRAGLRNWRTATYSTAPRLAGVRFSGQHPVQMGIRFVRGRNVDRRGQLDPFPPGRLRRSRSRPSR